MPFEDIPGDDIRYGLLSFAADGREREDDPAGKMSDVLIDRAVKDQITNVFFFCHGWMGDVVAARYQYSRWIKAFVCAAKAHDESTTVAGIRPMYIGLHWPSLPWGDEELTGGGAFAPRNSALGVHDLLQAYVARLGDEPNIRAALETILNEAQHNTAPEKLPTSVREAYLDLNSAIGLSSSGVNGPPDADREPFDPEESFDAANEESANFGGSLTFGGLLGPLRQLSYWTMKKRARTIGEQAMHSFLKDLQAATTQAHVRIHLMGHSFGTIVVSGMVGGPDAVGTLSRPVDSMALIQGAVSLWSYADSIPFPNTGRGYFNRIFTNKSVRGPIVTTSSKWDRAVGTFYPLASRMKGSPAFATGLPEYGAIGAFGIQGLPDTIRSEMKMADVSSAYSFEDGKVYNLDASQYICKGSGASGAHSDIAGPEVALAIWSAALTRSQEQ